MKVRDIVANMVAGSIVLTTASCKKESLHRVTDVVKNPIIERVDSFAKSNLNKMDTTGLKMFKVDTLEISNKELNNPKLLSKSILQNVDVRKDYVDGKTGYYSGNIMSVSDLKKLWTNNSEKDSIAYCMQNKVFANKSGNKYFVPVNCYGNVK